MPHTKREGFLSIVAMFFLRFNRGPWTTCTHEPLYTPCAPQRVLQLGRGWQAPVLGEFEGPSEPGAWPSSRVEVHLDILRFQESFKKVSGVIKRRPFSHELLKKSISNCLKLFVYHRISNCIAWTAQKALRQESYCQPQMNVALSNYTKSYVTCEKLRKYV